MNETFSEVVERARTHISEAGERARTHIFRGRRARARTCDGQEATGDGGGRAGAAQEAADLACGQGVGEAAHCRPRGGAPRDLQGRHFNKINITE
jgi:hypothetical protein